MKPLIVLEFNSEDYSPEYQEKIDKIFSESDLKDRYDIIVTYGCKVSVYNIPFLIKYYYKIKSWLIRRTLKKNIF